METVEALQGRNSDVEAVSRHRAARQAIGDLPQMAANASLPGSVGRFQLTEQFVSVMGSCLRLTDMRRRTYGRASTPCAHRLSKWTR